MTISELVAHEAKNILSMIHSRCELMRLSPVSNMSEDEVVAISHRLLNRLDRLSHFAALLGGGIDFGVVDFRQVIEDVMADIGDTFPQIYLEFQEFTSQSPFILGNRLFLYHILLNIVINAVQSMRGQGKLLMTLSSDDRLIILVEDSGQGMDAHVLANLFEKNFSTKETGFGIGLSLVKKLVQFHRGTIEVESFLSQGTSFRLYFPFYSELTPIPPPAEFIADEKLEAILLLFKQYISTIRHFLDTRQFEDLDTFVFSSSRQVYQVLLGH